MSKFIRINELIIHSAPSNRTISLDSSQRIIMIKNNFTDQNSCGVISERYFNTRLEHVLESINYNSCLNKKISVDTKGQIKIVLAWRMHMAQYMTIQSLMCCLTKTLKSHGILIKIV
jgi:lipopolysaccharide assembly outer membrane protein LptD (OstA)